MSVVAICGAIASAWALLSVVGGERQTRLDAFVRNERAKADAIAKAMADRIAAEKSAATARSAKSKPAPTPPPAAAAKK